MEKCTFCVQRIRQAKDHAKDDGRRRVRDGEVQPACVQSCPTEAIVFGDRKDPDSKVSKTMSDPRAYHVLEDLNTLPSIVYLKKVDANAS
jgi:molybdopterin-containing oxidoreductase family iron-sulfur binding subunit